MLCVHWQRQPFSWTSQLCKRTNIFIYATIENLFRNSFLAFFSPPILNLQLLPSGKCSPKSWEMAKEDDATRDSSRQCLSTDRGSESNPVRLRTTLRKLRAQQRNTLVRLERLEAKVDEKRREKRGGKHSVSRAIHFKIPLHKRLSPGPQVFTSVLNSGHDRHLPHWLLNFRPNRVMSRDEVSDSATSRLSLLRKLFWKYSD